MNLGQRTYSLRSDKLTRVAALTEQRGNGNLFKAKDIENLGSSIIVTVCADNSTLKAWLFDQDFCNHQMQIGDTVGCHWENHDLHELHTAVSI